MFGSKISKFCALLLFFGILFLVCPVSYAYTSLPYKGKPNSTQNEYNPDGSVKRKRYFDDKGRAEKDIDYNYGGEKYHEFPHVHDWEWEKEKSPRQPKEGELEKVAEITTAVAVTGTILYYVISEGSRIVFPIRNLIPVL